jgi:hypothetical protein
MGEYTLLELLSSLTLGTFHTISPGPSGIQYIHVKGQLGVDGVPVKAIPIAGDGGDGVKNELTETNLTNSVSRFIRKGYKLVRRSQIVFRGIELEEREMMLILSCTTPIIVQNVRGEEGSVFIAGQVSRATLQWLCDMLEVKFESNEPDGVFQTEYIDTVRFPQQDCRMSSLIFFRFESLDFDIPNPKTRDLKTQERCGSFI